MKTIMCMLMSAVFLPIAADADAIDPATGDFWYTEGRSSYPGSTAPAVATVVVATVPQTVGAPAFDSGVGDELDFVLEAGFTSDPCGFRIIFR